jgi:hypothetical protein
MRRFFCLILMFSVNDLFLTGSFTAVEGVVVEVVNKVAFIEGFYRPGTVLVGERGSKMLVVYPNREIMKKVRSYYTPAWGEDVVEVWEERDTSLCCCGWYADSQDIQ